ncbi:SSI family serine proteinase inhibitor [Actinomadura keratinilytica]|uniref:SSI family serine proteinase inhibitor n=1 Tax=Actinomadura keratinilytica TaxID=547461 RepID=UPI003614081C
MTCDPAGGDHPDAAKACAALNKAQDPFKPVSPQQICTEIYGGPQEAKVKGTWRGQQIDAGFTRKNGCELHRWNQVAPCSATRPTAADESSPLALATETRPRPHQQHQIPPRDLTLRHMQGVTRPKQAARKPPGTPATAPVTALPVRSARP